MTRSVFTLLMLATFALAVAVGGCRAEGEVGPDDTTRIAAPR